MALSRDTIYYHDFADAQGNNYRLELIPANCDADGNPVMLSTTPDVVGFPRNLIVNKLSTKNEYTDRGILPIGLPQRNELKLQVRIDREMDSADDWYALLGEPLSYRTTSPTPVFGQIPIKIDARDTEFLALPISPEVDTTYTVRSIDADVILDVETDTSVPGETTLRFKVDVSSPDAAFAIYINYSYNGKLIEQIARTFYIGNPAGYNTLAIPSAYRYGNLWRLWRYSGSSLNTILTECIQRRVPPVKKVISTEFYDFEITAIDVIRCALEQTTLADVRAKLTHRMTADTLTSVSSASTTVEYKLRNSERFHLYAVYRLFRAFTDATNIHLNNIRRTVKTLNINGPTHIKFYNFEDSTAEVPSPSEGYSFTDCSFVAYIATSYNIHGGVLAGAGTNADECWEKEYSNVFDLLTDFAAFTCSKYVVRYIASGGAASGITLYCYKPFGLHYGQTTAKDIAFTDFIGDVEVIHGDATIRGVSAEVAQPNADDKTEYKESVAASERDDELAPKILLHNIPTYNQELCTNTLYSPFDEGASTPPAPEPLSDVVEIDLGNDITIGPAFRFTDWGTSLLNRDQTIAAFQNNLNYATELCKLLVSVFGCESLLTINGTLLTTTHLNTSRLGSAYNVTIPGGRVVYMILVSCSEDCVTGTANVTLIGIDPQA